MLWFRKRRRETAGPLAAEQAAVLQRNVWQHRWLPPALRERMHAVVAEMVASRRWEGAAGLELTDEMRVTVAGAAALMTLGLDEPYLFDRVPAIVIHPGAFTSAGATEWFDGGGRLGEAWHRGPIVLSWADALRGARRVGRGENLVLHEFAHHVDGLNGEMDGSPTLDGEASERWPLVVGREYDRLVAQARRRDVTLLDQYGASNKAEFFAVATECFFERPHEMRARHAELYGLLSEFYRQDPTEWAPKPHRMAKLRDAARVAAPERIDVSGLGLSPADEAFTLGHEYYAAGRFGEAADAFGRVLEHDPDDSEALTLRAAARLETGDFPGARDDALRAVELDGENALAECAVAEALIELGQDAEAEAHARRALALERDHPDALLFCGMLALQAGRVREAIKRLKRLVILDRYWDEAHYWLACAYERAGDDAAAARHFERADWLAAQPDEEPTEGPQADGADAD